MKNAIGIFCKFPEEGKVKTRLAEDVGDKKAVDVYKKLIQHSIDCCYSKTKFADLVVLFDPPEKFNDFIGWLSQKHYYLEQAKGDLGARLEDASAALLTSHYNVSLIGSDCYDLSEDLLRRAFDLLEKKDLVIGPAEDGGYYLIAFKAHHEELFRDINWSSTTVLESTLSKAKKLKLSCQLLPPLSDIDTLDDLKKHPALYNEVFPQETPKHLLPLTEPYSFPPKKEQPAEPDESVAETEETPEPAEEAQIIEEETPEPAEEVQVVEENTPEPVEEVQVTEEVTPEAPEEPEPEEPKVEEAEVEEPEAVEPEQQEAPVAQDPDEDDDDLDGFEEGDFINPLYKLPPEE